ncbi:MAG: HU family DNA-binding protein [Campylobacterales bacterium]
MQENQVTLEQLAAEVALEAGFDEDTARDYLETLFETLSEQMARKETVQLRDFGTFKTVYIKARDGRNPQTGNALAIPPHHNVHFSPSKLMAENVNANYAHLAPRLIESRIYEEEEAESRYLMWIIAGLGALLVILLAWWWLSSKPEPVQAPAAPVTVQAVPPVQAAPAPEPKPERPAETPAVPATPAPVVAATQTVQAQAPQGGSHVVRPNETLWGIAWNRWSDATLWPAIYGDNRANISDPDRIFPGMTLRIGLKPDLGNPQEQLQLEDRFLDAYEAYKRVGKNERAVWLLYTARQKYGLLQNWADYEQIDAHDRQLLESFTR